MLKYILQMYRHACCEILEQFLAILRAILIVPYIWTRSCDQLTNVNKHFRLCTSIS